MKFELQAHKKLRVKLEELAKLAYELRLQCEKLRFVTPGTIIKITPKMFKPD